jgi:hypothetical protein
MTPAEQIHEKVLQLRQMLDARHPGMENWLRDIHQNLHKDESLVQCLTPEEIGVIVEGLERRAKTKIVEDAVNSKSKGLKNLTLDSI